MAIGRSSSSISLILNTVNSLLMDIVVGLFKNPAKVPVVYFCNRITRESAPSVEARIFWRSDSRGGSFSE